MRARTWLVTTRVAAVVVMGLIRSAGDAPISVDFMAIKPSIQKTEVTVTRLQIDGSKKRAESTVGNGGRLALVAAYSVRSSSSRPLVEAKLEQRVGTGDWVETGVHARRTSNGPLRVMTPSYSTEAAVETVHYRLVTDSSATASVSIRYENPRYYTGLASTMWQHMATYCPSAAVHVEPLETGEAGVFHSGSLLISISDRVGVTTNFDDSSQRTVALHECAHERQWLNWGGTSDGWIDMEEASSVLYEEGREEGDPLEHAADCAALSVVPDGYLGYGGSCSGAQLASGRRLLAGQQY